MKDDLKTEELNEAKNEVYRRVESEYDKIMGWARQLKGVINALEASNEIAQDNERLKEEMNLLRQQLQDEHGHRSHQERPHRRGRGG